MTIVDYFFQGHNTSRMSTSNNIYSYLNPDQNPIRGDIKFAGENIQNEAMRGMAKIMVHAVFEDRLSIQEE